MQAATGAGKQALRSLLSRPTTHHVARQTVRSLSSTIDRPGSELTRSVSTRVNPAILRRELMAQRAMLSTMAAPAGAGGSSGSGDGGDGFDIKAYLRLLGLRKQLDSMTRTAFDSLFPGDKTYPVSWVQLETTKPVSAPSAWSASDKPEAYTKLTQDDGGWTQTAKMYDVATQGPWYDGIIQDSIKNLVGNVKSEIGRAHV